MSEKDVRNESLIEVLKRSSAIRKDWGLLFGSFIMNRSLNAAIGHRPILRTEWIVTLLGLAISVWKLWLS
ncbi:hypothetical protein [Bradyrhizobium japonicum]|uniref:hypothetical protein n=1 Tax=Bradyrhizobium japonicum TaxID=375 RepID=UPI0005779084|nr:hypothetical protein [Bradyrhizobium japonicum]